MNIAYRRGAVSELVAATTMLEQGYQIFWPAQDGQEFDFVAERDGVFEKVQVKSARWQKHTGAAYRGTREALTVNLRTGRAGSPRYHDGDWSVLAAVARDGRVWLVPWDTVKKHTELKLDYRGELLRLRGHQRRPKYDPNEWLVKGDSE